MPLIRCIHHESILSLNPEICFSVVFIGNSEQILHIALVFLLVT